MCFLVFFDQVDTFGKWNSVTPRQETTIDAQEKNVKKSDNRHFEALRAGPNKFSGNLKSKRVISEPQLAIWFVRLSEFHASHPYSFLKDYMGVGLFRVSLFYKVWLIL